MFITFFMFLKISMRKFLLGKKKRKACDFLPESPTWPAGDLGLREGSPAGLSSLSELGMKTAAGRDAGLCVCLSLLIKVSGSITDHVYYMKCASVNDSAHEIGYGTIT